MGLLRTFICLPLLLVFTAGISQPAEYRLSATEYIEKFKEDAVKEMLLHGVPASITLAQGMLESGNGNSALAIYANNHFGIKCHAEWTGMTYIHDDDKKNECFRKYNSVLESFTDHSLFLKSRDRYSFLFKLQVTDYKGWAHGLKQAGYATDPQYAYRLIEIIEKHNLNDLDKMVYVPSKKDPQNTITPSQNISVRDGLKVKKNNQREYVVARKGDTYKKLADELDMGLWQLYKYNEKGKDAVLVPGEYVYLQPKRKQSENQDFHIVKKGETMHAISQRHGIKLKYLYRWNNMEFGTQPQPGQKLKLKKKAGK